MRLEHLGLIGNCPFSALIKRSGEVSRRCMRRFGAEPLSGRQREAVVVMQKTRGAQSPLDLLSEDFETGERRLWGNFPQSYSHVGLIHAALLRPRVGRRCCRCAVCALIG